MVDIFGGLLNFTIPTYVIIGILLIFIGIAIAVFVPIVGRKYGSIVFAIGLLLSVGFELIANWWKNDIFKAVIIGIIAIVISIIILFPSKKKI